MKLFPANGPLEFVSMDIMGPLSKMASENQYLLVITDHYSNITGKVPAATTTSTQLAEMFMEHLIMPYDIPTFLLTYKGPQFSSKFFGTLGGLL